MEPFVIAFALIGLIMAVLIVGNVISGAVIAQYQRIGALKSLGLTPAQVVAVYLSRIGWPSLAGCLIGVAGGYLLTIPVLHDSAGAYDVGRQQAPLWAPAAGTPSTGWPRGSTCRARSASAWPPRSPGPPAPW
jgi:putative ABC transport system permease protein